ncbi:MAG TPA: hypothetical protein VJ862_12950 [Rhodanobacteraceae bacterium]|nr:hypothetical protein [Rhodanobacteraceae bacterium]
MSGIGATPTVGSHAGARQSVPDSRLHPGRPPCGQRPKDGTNIRTTTIHPAAINIELLDTISEKHTLEQMQKTYDKYGISPDRPTSPGKDGA